jgi:drug/metabolite transporter (DMT)-like permease
MKYVRGKMSLFYASFGVAVFSSVLYHVFQRAIAPGVNPVISLMVTYLAALVLSALLLLLFPLRTPLLAAIRELNWASLALAVAIVGLEVGFLLAYRAGWNVSLAGVATNVAGALLLLPIGIAWFKERPSVINLLGVLVCVLGLWMVNARH